MIVVGVDGSEVLALGARFALKEARIRKTKLRIVVVWHVPLPSYGAGWTPPPPHLVEDAESAGEQLLAEALELAQANGARPRSSPSCARASRRTCWSTRRPRRNCSSSARAAGAASVS